MGEVNDICIDDVGTVCDKLGEMVVFFDNDNVDVFFSDKDIDADIDAEVGDFTWFPEPTVQDNNNFKWFAVEVYFCLPMFAFFSAIFGDNCLLMDFSMIVDLIEL